MLISICSNYQVTLHRFNLSHVIHRWAAGKSCLIAAVPTRDKEKVAFTTTSYYDAFAANRLLFKKIRMTHSILFTIHPSICHDNDFNW
jgi:hypothetical protein